MKNNTKLCKSCNQDKPLDDMCKGYNSRKDGCKTTYYKSLCKKCHNKKRAERRKKYGINENRRKNLLEKSKRYYINSEKRRNYIRDYMLINEYGITIVEYEELLEKQNFSCKICGINYKKTPKKVLDVDHCHSTGKIRGLLCMDCNNMLGRAKDNIDILQAGIEYLIDTK